MPRAIPPQTSLQASVPATLASQAAVPPTLHSATVPKTLQAVSLTSHSLGSSAPPTLNSVSANVPPTLPHPAMQTRQLGPGAGLSASLGSPHTPAEGPRTPLGVVLQTPAGTLASSF